MPKQKDFEYSVAELTKRIDVYFEKCKKENVWATDAGLALALDLPYPRYIILVCIADLYSEEPENAAEVKESYSGQGIQWAHLPELQRGNLRIMDALQQRKDPAAIFATKQPHLGGWIDKPLGKTDSEVKIIVKLAGLEDPLK